MRLPATLMLGFGLLLPCVPRAADTVPAAELWSRIEVLQKTPEPEPELIDNQPTMTKAYLEAVARRGAALGDVLMEFAQQYPQDSRHWDAVVALTRLDRPVFKYLGNLQTEGAKAVVVDDEAQQAWNARVASLAEKLVSADGVSKEHKQAGYAYWVEAAMSASRGESKPDPAEFRRRIDAMKAEFPQFRQLRMYEWQYVGYLRDYKPAAVVSYLTALKNDPNEAVAKWAQGELNTEALRETPVAYKFTALDGRKVDMAKMRGKVVLLDFWATWCGPCKAELPNVLANYEKYHARGFEVVAVALDEEKDKQELIDYVAEKKLPWPQHFDGKGRENEIAANHGITGIPAMFLFNKKGLLVSTQARGEDLAPQIERLLKQ